MMSREVCPQSEGPGCQRRMWCVAPKNEGFRGRSVVVIAPERKLPGLRRILYESGGYLPQGINPSTAAHLLRTCNAPQVRSRCRCAREGGLGVRGKRAEGKALPLPPPPLPPESPRCAASGYTVETLLVAGAHRPLPREPPPKHPEALRQAQGRLRERRAEERRHTSADRGACSPALRQELALSAVEGLRASSAEGK